MSDKMMKYFYLACLSLLFFAPVSVKANGEGPYRDGDFPKAFELFTPQAKDGVAEAQYYIGLMYAKGQAVPQDASAAVEWYQKAANQGHALAQNNLGYMYGQGAGVTRSFVNAHMWYSLAAAAGNVLSRENRDLIALKMTTGQISKSQSQARDWMSKHNAMAKQN
ncbi:MAG: sel1 repeat family protein [Alphaproteobacteria bacterium]|nr:sel1 repeat family protein [Alphaproteobacteria bacterium]